MSPPKSAAEPGFSIWGRPFWNPFWDLVIIGGGLSILTTALIAVSPRSLRATLDGYLLWPALLLNATHFSASYVRVYTKPGAVNRMPGISFFGPLVLFLTVVICVTSAPLLGRHLNSLYLTW